MVSLNQNNHFLLVNDLNQHFDTISRAPANTNLPDQACMYVVEKGRQNLLLEQAQGREIFEAGKREENECPETGLCESRT